jgi:hypothetical protein
MKTNSLFFSIICLFLLISCNYKSENQELKSNKETESVENPKNKLRHLVLFNFNDNVSTDSISIVQKAFSALPSKIPEIRDFEWGIDISVEDLHQGFTHAFLVTFGSLEDRAIYLPHPDHQEFVKMLTPMLDDVLVIDYWADR